MYEPIETSATNARLSPPEGWDEKRDGACQVLPLYFDGSCFYSWWRVPFRERLRILFGRPIRLVVVGPSHPPVCVETSPDKFKR